MENFYKFPSTPHLAVFAENEIRGDKVFSEDERKSFLSHSLVVEEKIDGANLGISFDTNGSLILQNRGTELKAPYAGQWKKLPEWINLKIENLFERLGDQYILFGEWCYAKHSIYYDRLPDWFIGFDIFDKTCQRFVSTQVRDALFRAIGIAPVPFVSEGCFSISEIENLFTTTRLGHEPCEGLYLRVQNDDWLLQRSKIVRHDFVQQIEEHWSRKQIVPNRLLSST